MSEILKLEGDSFFKKYSTIRESSKGLNESIAAKAHPLCNNFPRRAYYGVACAGIAEPQRVGTLRVQYLDYAAKCFQHKSRELKQR